jgi:hypothetical protein
MGETVRVYHSTPLDVLYPINLSNSGVMAAVSLVNYRWAGQYLSVRTAWNQSGVTNAGTMTLTLIIIDDGGNQSVPVATSSLLFASDADGSFDFEWWSTYQPIDAVDLTLATVLTFTDPANNTTVNSGAMEAWATS